MARDWLSTSEVRAMLGVSQQRVSQLVGVGDLVAERDSEGRLRYDRPTAEQYQRDRVVRRAESRADAESRGARQAEARERFARERRRAELQAAALERTLAEWRERIVSALETIAESMPRDSK